MHPEKHTNVEFFTDNFKPIKKQNFFLVLPGKYHLFTMLSQRVAVNGRYFTKYFCKMYVTEWKANFPFSDIHFVDLI